MFNIPQHFFYIETSSSPLYSVKPGGRIDINRLKQNKPYWLAPNLSRKQKPKTLILNDWRLRDLVCNDFSKIVNVIRELIELQFPVYIKTHHGYLQLTEFNLNEKIIKESASHFKPEFNKELIKDAYLELKTSPDKIAVIDDYTLSMLLNESMTIKASEINELNNEEFLQLNNKLSLGHYPAPVFALNIYPDNDDKLEEKFRVLQINFAQAKRLKKYEILTKPITEESLSRTLENTFKNLKSVNFFSTDLNSSCLKQLFEVAPNLKGVNLSFCRNFRGAFDLHGLKLNALEDIDLFWTDINSSSLTQLLEVAPNLRGINLGFCLNIRGALERHGLKLNALEKIDLSCTGINSSSVRQLFEVAPNLRIINLGNCDIGGALELHGLKLNALEKIDLSCTGINSSNVRQLFELAPNLRIINLRNCDIGGALELHSLKLNALEKIDLSSTGINSSSVRQLFEVAPNLKAISLVGYRNIGGALNFNRIKLDLFESINLSFTGISTSSLMQLFKRAINLKIIKLEYCTNLGGPFNLNGVKLDSLEEIYLSGTYIYTSSLLELFKSAPNLKKIYLRHFK